MSPKNTENVPLKKTEKEKRRTEEKIRKVYYVPNSELVEKLKKSLKKQPPGRVVGEEDE